MGYFLAFFLGWIIFAYVFAELVPVIIVGIGYLLAFLGICLWQVLKFSFMAIAWLLALPFRGIVRTTPYVARGTAWGLRQTGRRIYLGATFLFFLLDEWRRGPGEEDPAQEQYSEAEQDFESAEAFGVSAYDQALALLGLQLGFTQTDLNRNYKRAIRKAHPDAGGSVEEAQAVNMARDLIVRAMGWT